MGENIRSFSMYKEYRTPLPFIEDLIFIKAGSGSATMALNFAAKCTQELVHNPTQRAPIGKKESCRGGGGGGGRFLHDQGPQ